MRGQLSSLMLGPILLFSSYGYSQDFLDLTSPCNPVSLATCALPYPSDVYAKPDVDSPTGRRLDYPAGAVRQELFESVPPTLTPQSVFNGSTGYSAASSVLFELDAAPDLTTLPEDGGESVVALNLRTGERVPVRVQLSAYARSKLVSSPSHIVEIFPRARWKYGERYGVFLTRALKASSGQDYAKSAGFTKALSNDGSDLANFYAPAIKAFEKHGIARDELVSATFFTVRDEAEVTGRLIRLSEYVYNQDHPIRNVKIRYKLLGNIAAFVTGEVRVHNFRDEYGGMVYDTSKAEDNWIQFRLALPRAAKKGPVPIAIFSHGIGFFKESGIETAISNAKLGVATIAIDHPNHGSRIQKDGGYVLMRVQTRFVPMQVGMMTQTSIDHMSLLKAIKTSIGSLDIVPKRRWSPLVTSELNNGDGVSDIDTNTIFYQGISLGGVLGATFLSLAPDVKGAVLNVSGVGVTNILAGSLLWNPVFSHLEPDVATGAEALLLKAAMQHEIDYGDAINFVHYLRNPVGMASPKPIVVIAGRGDGVVPNFSTFAFAEIAGLPLVGESTFPMPGVSQQSDFDDGYGVLQFETRSSDSNHPLKGLVVHFSSDRADKAVEQWTQRFILE